MMYYFHLATFLGDHGFDFCNKKKIMEYAVTQLVEALSYKGAGEVLGSIPELSLTLYFRPWVPLSFLQKLLPGIFPAGEGGMCLELTSLPPSSTDCLEFLGPTTSGSPNGLFRPVQG